MTALEQRLVAIYRRARENLMAEIRRRAQFGRSTAWQQETLKLIDRELRIMKQDVTVWAQDAVQTSFLAGARAGWAATGVSGSFGPFIGLHKRAIQLMAHNTVSFLALQNDIIARQAKDRVREIGVEITTRKFTEGLTVRETTKLLENKLLDENFMTVPWRNGRGSMRVDSYAQLVARTTTREATNTGTINQALEMGQPLVKMTHINTTCAVCAARQGRVYRLVEEDYFPADDPRRQLPHIREGMPRWPTYKTVHPNCFVSGTPILAKGVMAHSSRDYVGEVVTITIANGDKLTVTPNHPVLTPKGWISAGALVKGDKVVKYTRIDDFLVGQNPNDIKIPTFIEQVPGALRKSCRVSANTVEGAPEQFHGDGTHGKVTIIHTDSLLRSEVNPSRDKKVSKFKLIRGFEFSRLLLAQSALFQILSRALHSTNRIVRCTDARQAIFFGHSRHHDTVGFRASLCRWVPSLRQTLADSHLRHAEVLGNGFLGHPALVQFDNQVDRQGYPFISARRANSRADVGKLQPRFLEPLVEDLSVDIEDGADLFDRLSGKVELADIIQVDVNLFHGKVYNLQTKSGWYLANNIITHNCRHNVTIFVWNQKREQEQADALAESTRPFDKDPRSEAEVARYNEGQRKNAERLRDRKQWERYQATLGKENVPSFSGFRRMKAADSENFRFMRLDYARQNRLQQNPELALPNAAKATAADAKFTGYLFNPNSTGGAPKGVAFTSRLGYDAGNWQSLQSKILQAAPKYPATLRYEGEHGRNYEQKVVLHGERGRPANVVLGWQNKGNETWLATALIKEVGTNGN